MNDSIHTNQQLVVLRRRATKQLNNLGWFEGTFTCDNCSIRNRCRYVFDAYNTNGDCLAEK